MLDEPAVKRTHVFIDGQNLFHSIKEAFGYSYPNYDIHRLADEVCRAQNWKLEAIRFYTGIPDLSDNPAWHNFWMSKLSIMGRQGIKVFTRPLRYQAQAVRMPNGKLHTFLTGQEKGIDVRIALDIVREVRMNTCDVIVIFSQDQDLSEVADEIRLIATEKNRWIKIATAFPISAAYRKTRGINKTDWICIDRELYDRCIDPRDYRIK